MMNRYNQIKNVSYIAILSMLIGCTKVDFCENPEHIHKVPGKTTVTVDWEHAVGDDAEKENMKFAFYPENGGEPVLVESDYGFVQAELEPGNYRVIAFNRKAKNMEITFPIDYRRVKASVSTLVGTRADEVVLDTPGWFTSGVGTVEVDNTRTGELLLDMQTHVRKMNILVNIEGDYESVKQVKGELTGLSRSINLNTGKPQGGETGRVEFVSVLQGSKAEFNASILGVDPDAEHYISFLIELNDGTTKTVKQNITDLLKDVNETDLDVQLDVVATIIVNTPEEGGEPEIDLDNVSTTGATTFVLDWGEFQSGVVKPSKVCYAIYPADGREMLRFDSDNRKLTIALEPGNYQVIAYGDKAENITVNLPSDINQATARAVAVEGYIPEPGYFFLGRADITVNENAIQSYSLPINNRTKDFRIGMKVKGDGRLISKIEATLTGISEAISMNTGEVIEGGNIFVLHVANDATEINISGRILGIDPNSKQIVHLKLTYKNGLGQEMDQDISDLVDDFNEKEPGDIPDIEADVEVSSPTNTEISATITNWKVTERDITPDKGGNK